MSKWVFELTHNPNLGENITQLDKIHIIMNSMFLKILKDMMIPKKHEMPHKDPKCWIYTESVHLQQGSSNLSLEGQSAAEFSSNPDQTHLPVIF